MIKGKDEDGEDAFWQVLIFAPKTEDYHLMTVVGSDKADKKTGGGSRCDAIVNSVKAASDDE